MNNTYFSKAVSLIGKKSLRQLLEDIFGTMSLTMINKALRKGYAPPDWYEIIELATNHQITIIQLYNDCYKNKRKCKPAVVRKQINNFRCGLGKSTPPVRKNRQASEKEGAK